MRVKKLLKIKGRDVFTIPPDATIFEASQKMAEKEIGALIVTENGKMVGIVSERDYARKVILTGKDPQETKVAEIMTSEVVTTNPEMKVEKCLSIMAKKKFRHLPVLEKEELVGVISIEDVKSAS